MLKNIIMSALVACSLVACSSGEADITSQDPSTNVASEAKVESVGKAEQTLINCLEPSPFKRRLTDIVVTGTTPNNPAVCPRAWYSNYDPMEWRAGFQPVSPAPKVPLGNCQWIGR